MYWRVFSATVGITSELKNNLYFDKNKLEQWKAKIMIWIAFKQINIQKEEADPNKLE